MIQEIIELAKKNHVDKVILFGSRARGDYKERSDIDLAFFGGHGNNFILDVDEETSTLLEFDVINMDRPVKKELLEAIKHEGVVIYEKYENFKAALKKLKDIYSYHEPYGNVEITGMVGLYEICFEQAWKAMKEILENFGYAEDATGSSRTVLKTAYRAGMLENEEVWLDALVSRNNVAHAYNEAIAMDIINRTKNEYYNMFVKLDETIEKNWVMNRYERE